MSSLVAYYGGSSDEEEDNEMDTETEVYRTPAAKAQGPSTSASTSSGIVKSSPVWIGSIEDDDDEGEGVDSLLNDDMGMGDVDVASTETSCLKLETILPQPKGHSWTELQSGPIEVGPIPPKKVYGDEEKPKPHPSTFANIKTTKSAKGVVQISIPSLKTVRKLLTYLISVITHSSVKQRSNELHLISYFIVAV